MSPAMTDRQSVAANTKTGNLLAGKTFEFAGRPSQVTLYASAAAVGLNVSLQIGNEVLVDDQEINAQNRMPLVPDDYVAKGGAFAGDRIVLTLRNTTGGAIVGFTRVDVDPLA